MINNRHFRASIFKTFYNSAAESFEKIHAEDSKKHQRVEDMPFVVAPGGLDGGDKKGVVEVAFGPIPAGEDLISTARNPKVSVQYGAKLVYLRFEDGCVICNLHAPSSTNSKPITRGYVLEKFKVCTSLTGIPKLKEHYRYLRALNEVGRIDGQPTTADKLRVLWIKFFKRRFVSSGTEIKSKHSICMLCLLFIVTSSLTVATLFFDVVDFYSDHFSDEK